MKRSKILKIAYRREEGQSVVEAALVLPLLVIILCGILDFGWIFAHQIMLNNASRDAARYAAINYGDPELQTIVADKIRSNPGMGGGEDLYITVTKTGTEDVEVRVVKQLRVLTPLAGIFTADQTIDIESVTVMWAG